MWSRAVICGKLSAILTQNLTCTRDRAAPFPESTGTLGHSREQAGGQWLWEVALSHPVTTGVHRCHSLETSEISYAKSDLGQRFREWAEPLPANIEALGHNIGITGVFDWLQKIVPSLYVVVGSRGVVCGKLLKC